MLPLRPEECRYYCASYKDQYYIWRCVAQGSVNGPSTYGRSSALTAIMTKGLVDTTSMILQVYIDDPCLTLRGTPAQCSRYVAIVVL